MATPVPPTLDPQAPTAGKYSVGTLTYDRATLFKVFFWMLWGDFVLTLMDGGVVANVVQVQLKAIGASNTTIGFLSGTVTALLSAAGVAAISTASDRHRGRLGRRIPFMLYTAPPLALCLIGVGYADSISAFLASSSPRLAGFFGNLAAHLLPGVATLPASAHLILAVMTFLLIAYRIFDLFPGTVYYCLWADVIPAKLIGMFACSFRIVGAIGMFVFNFYLLKYADTHPRLLYVGAGILYLVSFTVMCLMVREGDYPPPPPRESHNPVARVVEYFRTSYSIPFYWKFFAMSGSFIIAVKSLQSFVVVFGKQYTDDPGKLLSAKDLISLVPFLLLAPVIDRFHPLRTGIVALLLVLISGIASFVFISGKLSFAICMTCTFVSIAVYQAATGAINVRLLPREQFGQFNSANVILWQIGWAISATVCGAFLDQVGDYRYLMLWFSVLIAFSFGMTMLLYKHWKRLGGDEHYVAPLPKR